MEEFSRREFVKRSAAGLLIAGTGGSIIASATAHATGEKNHSMVEALTQCPAPRKPDRVTVGGTQRINCPSDDPEEMREYSALIYFDSTKPASEQEEVILEGVDFDPFDGSWVYALPLVSGSKYYLCRSICSNYPPGSTPEDGAGVMVVQEKLTQEWNPKRFARPPKPKRPKLEKKAVHTETVSVVVPKWEPQWRPEPGQLTGTVKWCRLKRVTKDKENDVAEWPLKTVKKHGNNKRHIKKADEVDEVFDGRERDDYQLGKSDTHYYVTEVMYDYGDTVPKAWRYRGARSKPLVVNMMVHDKDPQEEE